MTTNNLIEQGHIIIVKISRLDGRDRFFRVEKPSQLLLHKTISYESLRELEDDGVIQQISSNTVHEVRLI